MRKIDSVAAAFVELNHKIVADILARGYSHADAETLSTVRENLKVLKEFEIDEPAVPVAAPAKTKADN